MERFRKFMQAIDSRQHPYSHHCFVTVGLMFAAWHEIVNGDLPAAIGFVSNIVWLWR